MPAGTLTGAVSNGKKRPPKLLHWSAQIKGAILATPNYGFEKRQKELAKKRKKEDKLKAKSDRKSGLLPEDGSDPDAEEGDDASQSPTTGDAPDAPAAPSAPSAPT
jgi:hypothetical protein